MLLLVLMSSLMFSQSSGTFKVAKKEPKQKGLNQLPNRGFSISARTTLAGKSSPKKVRDYHLMLGYVKYIGGQRRRLIDLGISLGKSNPNINYNGYTLGAFLKFRNSIALGPNSVAFPIEIGYNKLVNKLDFENLNQYSIAAGMSIHIPTIPGTHFTVLGSYRIDSNLNTTTKGFYPTFGFDYYF